ncbi:MAG: ComF family protein [Clostridia bacterium]|nr:ComF family protein [Bacillota bacterium]MBQ7596704.1 ComF family protein [Clostridia bacterium]
MSDVLKTFRAFLWPEKCVFCGRPGYYSQKNVCERCADSLPYIRGKTCAACGCEKPFCSCRSSIMYYDRFTAPLYYENEVRKSIHRLKFSSRKEYAKTYAALMAERVRSEYYDESFDFITAVPMRGKERSRRGYNQSEEIAKALAELIGTECKKDLIKKIYSTERQSDSRMVNRTGNVFGVFDVAENIDGKSVLLVDDVRTTGSTLSECGKMLYLMGAKRVCCISLAAVKYNKKAKE